MEGFLPPMWCLIWYIIMIPIVGYGLYQIRKMVDENPDITALLAVSGAFMFVLSSLKLPSVTGSCSHPCGNGLWCTCNYRASFPSIITCTRRNYHFRC